MSKVNILGSEYEIVEQTESENPKLGSADGLCEIFAHKIVLRKLKESQDYYDNIEGYKNKVLRHEIVHAFFAESGLYLNYGKNESLVDWLAIQIPKMAKVMNELDIL